MLTFEQKQAIIDSFPELTKKEISLKRVNYHFMDSLYEKTIVVEKLHPNGNGFVFIGDLLRYEEEANKGLVNIRDYDEQQLREIIEDAIQYLSEEAEDQEPIEEVWQNREGAQLMLAFEQRSWNVYHGENLEEAFGTHDAAKEYLLEEGFRKKK
ncbi:hypothetical protein LAV72_10670 [Lysinibacillus xylanilyticus]|uniref:hypothetical protein n=1 Tax=Lysinibacillus xylanilyticus TaxID=582475 RepID=UPI002B24C1FA|nr:hypothetical protein [Lysinibacillus xylanilyticus]MEB2300080.1 hypothetical protein [Lysinibacillus xylanilyticus]